MNKGKALVLLEAFLEVADEDRLDGVVELVVDEALEASWKKEKVNKVACKIVVTIAI